jgi:hypothetical protein
MKRAPRRASFSFLKGCGMTGGRAGRSRMVLSITPLKEGSLAPVPRELEVVLVPSGATRRVFWDGNAINVRF